jgi:hypothetical protein
MVQRRICLSTTVPSLALADVALRYKRLQPDKVPEFAVDLLVDAFTAAWPCADGEQQEPARPIAHEWVHGVWAGGDASDLATVYAGGFTELLTKDHLVCSGHTGDRAEFANPSRNWPRPSAAKNCTAVCSTAIS